MSGQLPIDPKAPIKRVEPGHVVDILDLFLISLPEFDEAGGLLDWIEELAMWSRASYELYVAETGTEFSMIPRIGWDLYEALNHVARILRTGTQPSSEYVGDAKQRASAVEAAKQICEKFDGNEMQVDVVRLLLDAASRGTLDDRPANWR